MNNMPLNATLMSVITFLWQFVFALLAVLIVAFLCLTLLINQASFQKEYDYTKLQWRTKVLPVSDVMTVSLYHNQKFNYGLTQNEILLSGYYGDRVEKVFPLDDIQDQVIYLDRADIPKPIIGDSYIADHVTLWVTDSRNQYERPLIFLKEATIKNLGEYVTPTTDKQRNIGKHIITGTDFIKNKDIIEKNLRWNMVCSKLIVSSLLMLLLFLTYKFRNRLSLFHKGLLVLIGAEFLFYLYQTSIPYFNALT